MKNVIIWGNHSSTQFPDVAHATVCCDGKQQSVYEAVNNDTWLKGDFITVICLAAIVRPPFLMSPSSSQTIQGRGAAVIKARKLSSAMSAAKAICDHLRDWWFGSPDVSIYGKIILRKEPPKDTIRDLNVHF